MSIAVEDLSVLPEAIERLILIDHYDLLIQQALREKYNCVMLEFKTNVRLGIPLRAISLRGVMHVGMIPWVRLKMRFIETLEAYGYVQHVCYDKCMDSILNIGSIECDLWIAPVTLTVFERYDHSLGRVKQWQSEIAENLLYIASKEQLCRGLTIQMLQDEWDDAMWDIQQEDDQDSDTV